MNIFSAILLSTLFMVFLAIKNIFRNKAMKYSFGILAGVCFFLHAYNMPDIAEAYTLGQIICYVLLLLVQVVILIFVIKKFKKKQV